MIFINVVVAIYSVINVFALMGCIIVLPELLDETENPVEYSLPILCTSVWDELRDNLNIAGSVIVEILIHLFILPAIITLSVLIYIVITPCKYIGKLFCYVFRNRDKAYDNNDDYLDIKSDMDC